jgi:rare lipoprotein A
MKSIALSVLIAVLAVGECQAQAVGLASYYNYSASAGLVAAHRTLPVGAHVKVTNLGNGKSTTVVIVGRGPFVPGRIIDVSKSAAEALGFRQAGVAQVRIETVQP